MTISSFLLGGLILFTVFVNEALKKVSPSRKKCPRCGFTL
jgi:hypothetical protein